MYKKILMLVFTMVLVFGLSLNAFAAETVTFTSDSKLKYNNNVGDKISLGDEFIGMAPGETREQVITITNNNEQTADFYVSAKTIQSLENLVKKFKDTQEDENSGLISVLLKVVSQDGSKNLYNSKVGVVKNNDDLIFNINRILEKDTFLATLKKGESINFIISIGLDGESIRNDELINDFSDATGLIEFDFSVFYDTPKKKVVVEKSENVINMTVFRTKVANTVAALKTGDTTPIFALSSILIIGTIIIFLTGKKKKKLEEIS